MASRFLLGVRGTSEYSPGRATVSLRDGIRCLWSAFLRVRAGVGGLDADQLQLECLPGPRMIGVHDHHPVLDFDDTNQAVPAAAVLDSQPLADGKGLVFGKPLAVQAANPVGVWEPIRLLGGYGELRMIPRSQADQTQAQPRQARVVGANRQFQGAFSPRSGRGDGAVLKVLHVMDL